MIQDEVFIRRCFDIARLGAGKVAPNPMVGAVLVHQDKIIGEGYHMAYGGPHAEVNAVNSVANEFKHLISKSCLYISLEPCCIFGKTPPCTNLILEKKIPKVVISCLDQTPNVNGQAVQLLREAGVEVHTNILKNQGLAISQFRQTFVKRKRPYVILKFAQSTDGYIGQKDKQIWISNELTKRLVHKWRSEVDAILIGTNTAKLDNPLLTNRLYFGKSPIRVVLDRRGILPNTLQLFDKSTPTLIITEKEISFDEKTIFNLLCHLHQKNITSLLVEGGAQLVNSFIEANIWDEARVFHGNKFLNEGIKAPLLPFAPLYSYQIKDNSLKYYQNNPSQ